jgi:hypothetical protein
MKNESERKVNNYCIISKYFFAHSKTISVGRFKTLQKERSRGKKSHMIFICKMNERARS